MFSDAFIVKPFKAAVIPVFARVLLTTGDVFQSQAPDL
jgi:hypothetical protein